MGCEVDVMIMLLRYASYNVYLDILKSSLLIVIVKQRTLAIKIRYTVLFSKGGSQSGLWMQ